jgi:ribonuclease D
VTPPITDSDTLARFCAEAAAHPYITVDTEFLRERTYYAQLCLVQVARPGKGDEGAVLIDTLSDRLSLDPLYELFRNRRVLKVFHAARQDLEIFQTTAGVLPEPFFDTQVAAMVCGYGDQVGYETLVRQIARASIDKSSRFTDWSRRPLTDKQLVYALGDVTHLRDVYRHLKTKLDATGRTSWLSEEMADLTHPETYETRPEDAWKRLKMRTKNRKSFGVLIELAAWRERIAQAQNVPRSRVLRDEALYDIANQMPTTAEQLGGLRTLSDGFSRSQRAREIIEAVKAGMERDPKSLPPLNHARQVSAEAGATIELLKVLLKAAAAKNGVAPRLIADAEELERIAAENEPDVLALKGWRRQLFGEDALKLKRGELALTLAGGEVMILDGKGST